MVFRVILSGARQTEKALTEILFRLPRGFHRPRCDLAPPRVGRANNGRRGRGRGRVAHYWREETNRRNTFPASSRA